jgi:hypothetical protein
MSLVELLSTRKERIVDHTLEAMRRAHLSHYEALGAEHTRRLVEALFDVTVATIQSREARPMLETVDRIAEERYTRGFDLFEVQTAFNGLEEATWREVTESLPPEQLGEALGLVSTALGIGKDGLARGFVARATKTKAPSLDLRALFSGT